jgi:hypothetical protein
MSRRMRQVSSRVRLKGQPFHYVDTSPFHLVLVRESYQVLSKHIARYHVTDKISE